MHRQEAPFAVQIELVEGCPLRCTFCGLNGIRGKKHDYKFMTAAVLGTICSQIADAGWNVRLEFAMHGEPTKHPELTKMVSIARSYLPKVPIMVTSNGAGLMTGSTVGKLKDLFDAGLTTLAIDEYQGIKWADTVRSYLGTRYNSHVDMWPGVDFYEYPANPKGNPHQRTKRKRIVIIAPIDEATTGTHSSLNNHTGCGAPLNDRGVGKRCAKPFRELSFRWDGGVAVCCNDWRGVLPIGNILDMTLDELWQHPRLQAVRKMLYHRRRDMPPCVGCDATSHRVGLLPDKKGKADLPEPTLADLQILSEAMAEGPMTTPVLRDWEK